MSSCFQCGTQGLKAEPENVKNISVVHGQGQNFSQYAKNLDFIFFITSNPSGVITLNSSLCVHD